MRIKNKINKELENNVPNLCDNIIKSVDWQEVRDNNCVINQKKKFNFRFAFAGVFCMALICCFAIIPIINFNNNIPNSYSITLNVNPSVRLQVDKNDIVTKQIGLNKDGIILLYKQNLVGEKSEEACKILVQELYSSGFKNDTIQIKIKDDKGNNFVKKQNEMLSALEGFSQNLSGLKISELDETKFEELEDYYEENPNITTFEQNLIVEFKNKIISLTQTKIERFQNFVNSLAKYSGKDETLITDITFLKSVKEFCRQNNIENEFDLEVTKLDILEFSLELKDIITDFTDILEDLENGGDEDDYAEILDDLFDSAKELLYEEF